MNGRHLSLGTRLGLVGFGLVIAAGGIWVALTGVCTGEANRYCRYPEAGPQETWLGWVGVAIGAAMVLSASISLAREALARRKHLEG